MFKLLYNLIKDVASYDVFLYIILNWMLFLLAKATTIVKDIRLVRWVLSILWLMIMKNLYVCYQISEPWGIGYIPSIKWFIKFQACRLIWVIIKTTRIFFHGREIEYLIFLARLTNYICMVSASKNQLQHFSIDIMQWKYMFYEEIIEKHFVYIGDWNNCS